MSKSIKLGASYIRFQYFPHLLLALVFCLASGGFVSFTNLDISQSAKVLEMYVAFTGLLLMTPLFMPEQDKEIWQLEQTKKTPMWQIYLVRLLIAIVCIVLIVSVFLLVLQSAGSDVYGVKMWLGSVSEIVFLGAIGYAVSAITNQVIIGYMASVVYYAVNIGKNVFGKLALFQMQKGCFDFSGWMLLAAAVLIIAGILIREHKK